MNDHTQNADAAEPPATHFSRTAVLSAMFALPVCCPPMSLLACITGGVALWQIRRNPLARGAWLAEAGCTPPRVRTRRCWKAPRTELRLRM